MAVPLEKTREGTSFRKRSKTHARRRMPIQTVLACLSMTPSRRPSRHPRRRRARDAMGPPSLPAHAPPPAFVRALPRTASRRARGDGAARRAAAARPESAECPAPRARPARVHAAVSGAGVPPPRSRARRGSPTRRGLHGGRASAAACTRRRARCGAGAEAGGAHGGLTGALAPASRPGTSVSGRSCRASRRTGRSRRISGRIPDGFDDSRRSERRLALFDETGSRRQIRLRRRSCLSRAARGRMGIAMALYAAACP